MSILGKILGGIFKKKSAPTTPAEAQPAPTAAPMAVANNTSTIIFIPLFARRSWEPLGRARVYRDMGGVGGVGVSAALSSALSAARPETGAMLALGAPRSWPLRLWAAWAGMLSTTQSSPSAASHPARSSSRHRVWMMTTGAPSGTSTGPNSRPDLRGIRIASK